MQKSCLVEIVFFIASCIFPPLFIVFIPYMIYSAWQIRKNESNQKEVDELLKQTFSSMTPTQIEQKRIELINILNDPYTPEASKQNAKYAIRYIEKHFMGL